MTFFEWMFVIIVGSITGYLWVESGDKLARKYYIDEKNDHAEDKNGDYGDKLDKPKILP